jgi:hypothetical protein
MEYGTKLPVFHPKVVNYKEIKSNLGKLHGVGGVWRAQALVLKELLEFREVKRIRPGPCGGIPGVGAEMHVKEEKRKSLKDYHLPRKWIG